MQKNPFRTLRFRAILYGAAIAAAFDGSFPAAASAQIPQSQWQQIVDLQEQAYQAQQQEQSRPNDAALRRRCIDKYARAYQKLDAQLRSAPGIDAVTRVRLDYRCALFADYAAMPFAALPYYWKCQDNAQALEAARWENRVSGVPLRRLVASRVNSLLDEINKARLGHMHSETHPKGSIEIVPSRPLDNLTPEDQAKIASHLCFAGDEDRAAKMGQSSLLFLDGRQCVSIKPGLVVFGLDGPQRLSKQELQSLTDALAARLDKFRQKFNSRFFRNTSGEDGPPPILTVYANLVPYDPALVDPGLLSNAQSGGRISVRGSSNAETFGRELSENLHFSQMGDLEGYYQPLDNSVVLRKGLRAGNKWYFGTACHETAHALIHASSPGTPLWLDEGLASMHEAMIGDDQPDDNYRLYYLKAALRYRCFPLIENLAAADYVAQEDATQRMTAAMSRYFCIFLGERGKLPSICTEFRDRNPSRAASKDGDALLKITGAHSLEALNADFQKFIEKRDTAALAASWGYLDPQIQKFVRDHQEALVELTKPPSSPPPAPKSAPLPIAPSGSEM